MRIYDPRIGKFLSVDPLTKEYPMLTPYQFSGNEPISNIDLDGLESQKSIDGKTINGPFNIRKVNEDIWNKADNQQRLAMLKNATLPSLAGGIGIRAMQAGVIRVDYARKNYSLKPVYDNGTFDERVEASDTRNNNVLKARKYTPEPYLSFSEDLKSAGSLKNNPNGRFYKTNVKVNVTMGLVGAAGTGLTVYGAYTSFKNIQNSDNKPLTAIEEGASWTGAYYGGGMGGAWGATAGPWGALFGSVGGSLVGGIAGKGAVKLMFESGGQATTAPPWLTNGTSAPDNTTVKKPDIIAPQSEIPKTQ